MYQKHVHLGHALNRTPICNEPVRHLEHVGYGLSHNLMSDSIFVLCNSEQ